MMKKAISLLVFGHNWPLARASVKFGECICCSIYTCFAFCLFVSLFLVTGESNPQDVHCNKICFLFVL